MSEQEKNIENIYPLSPMQQGMLFHTLLSPKSGVYFNQILYTLTGELQKTAMQRAWQQVADRHEPLRTLFVWEGREKPLQVVRRRVTLSWEELDWRGFSADEQSAKLAAFLQADRQRGFDLAQAPLMRLALIRLEESNYELIWSHHHLLMDGWSLFLILKDVRAIYQALSEGRDYRLERLRPYRDYINWLQGQDLSKAEGFWRAALKGFAVPTPLLGSPVDVRHEDQVSEVAEQLDKLSSSLMAALRSFARRHDLTLSTIIHGAWGMLLSRYSGEGDVVFGSTVSGRPAELAGVESMVGLFINTLPVRAQFSLDDTVVSWLKEFQSKLVELRQYEHSPLVDVQGWSEVHRDQPLFGSLLLFENYPVDAWEQPGALKISNIRGFERTNYPLTVVVVPRKELAIRVRYDPRRFDAAVITRMLGHFNTLLAGIVANPEKRLSELPLLTSAERQQIVVEWNRTEVSYPQDRCPDEFIEEQAERTPAAVAVVFEGKHLTYRQLNERANQLAHYLQKLGVGPDTLVGICVERSLEMVVGLLGILKAGGAYVPLDPNYPQDRLTFILDDARPRVLLTQQSLRDRLRAQDATVLCLDALTIPPAGGEHVPSASERQASDLAYVIYTSGSTGQPKGVQITHGALVNFLKAMEHDPGITEEDKLLSVTSLSFDIAGLELYLPLMVGAQVTIAPSEVAADGSRLALLISECGATIMQATPATWRLLLEAGWEGSQHLKILCGGEAWSAELARALLPRCASLWNMYGPTETTVWSSVAKIEANQPVLVGPPIANTTFYVFDAYCQPVPIAVPGELHIGGIGLARGYHNRAELTAEKFIPDPFRSEHEARLYKTGDLVRYLPDGAIEYLGRLDHQVKIRGFRIELGEIESVLAGLPGVREAVVVAREDVPGDKRLVAYLTTHGGETLKDSELRGLLQAKLPDYMVPSAFVTLDRLPLTPNGKVDRRALPRPDFQSNPVGFVPPASATEQALANIWGEVLGIEQVGRHDNFFELGGHSLLAVRLISRIHATLGVEIALRSIFEASTVERMAEIVSGQKSISSYSPVVLLRPGAGSPPVFIVHGLGGSVMELIPVAKSFPGDKPIYGIQAKGLDGRIPNHTVESMAEDYINAITEMQPRGPYILVGVSFGGLVALEIAHCLIERGDQIGFLGLLETYPSRRIWPLLPWVKHKVKNNVTRRIKKHLSALRPLSHKERAQHVLTQLGILIRKFAGTHVDVEDPLPPAVRAVLSGGRAAAKSYRPRYYPGEINYLKCESNTFLPDDPVPIWRHLVKRLEVQSVPGDHMGFAATQAADVANWIFSRIQSIDVSRVNGSADITAQVGDGGGPVAELVGIEGGVVSRVFKSSDGGASDTRPRVVPDLPDWTRERPIRPWDPSRKLLLSIRRYQYWRKAGPGLPRLISKLVVLRYRFWSVIAAADIPINGRIGGGLLLPHPNGVVIDQNVVIGANCTIFQQVTIGDARNSRQEGMPVPVIGNNVELGAGAKVLGDIRVGDYAKIGANAVVLQDIPPHAIAVGIPARIKRVPPPGRHLHHQQRQLPADQQGDNLARGRAGQA